MHKHTHVRTQLLSLVHPGKKGGTDRFGPVTAASFITVLDTVHQSKSEDDDEENKEEEAPLCI